jgi:uncharacterized protein (TIGR03790 family)
MIRRSLSLILFFCLMLGPAVATAQGDYSDVLLIVNDRSWTSRQIGEYFAERRSIPEHRICRIDVDTLESMDSATFVSLKWSIEAWMRERKLVDSINYIVTTKGCPLRITTYLSPDQENWQEAKYVGQCSFEQCLMLINGIDSAYILAPKLQGIPFSKYHGAARTQLIAFRRDPVEYPMYLVTRLDAFTLDQAKEMILRAENPASARDGLIVLDADPTREGNLSGYMNILMRHIASKLEDRGLNVLLNDDANYVRSQQNVIGYSSFGSNDPNAGGYAGSLPRNSWLNGAIAQMFVSTSARTFANVSGGQTLIGELIAEGASGVLGYTDEPYASSMAHPNILYDYYTSGMTMAESFHAAMPYVAWRQVVVGDPKMRLRMEPAGITADNERASASILSVSPNPADSRAIVRLDVAPGAAIRLYLYDMLGQSYPTGEQVEAGSHFVLLKTSTLSSGAYVLRLESEGRSASRMLLIQR